MTRMSTSIITNLATWCCISQNIVQYVIHAYEIHSAVLQRLWSCDHTALFLCERTSRPPHWKCVKKSKVRLRQSMRIYLKNNPDKCYPNSIWNDWDLGFFKEHRPTRTRRITRWVAIWDQFLIKNRIYAIWESVRLKSGRLKNRLVTSPPQVQASPSPSPAEMCPESRTTSLFKKCLILLHCPAHMSHIVFICTITYALINDDDDDDNNNNKFY